MTKRRIVSPLDVIVIEAYDGLVPAKKPWRKETLDQGKDRDLLHQLQALTGNGLIEVTPPIVSAGDRLVVNEEGLLLRLPVNHFATFIAHGVLISGLYIAGTAVVVGPYDGEGNFTNPRAAWEQVLERMWHHVTAERN